MIYKTLKLTFGLVLISTLTACDSDIFNQFFRNPYIVEIAELDKMEANKWYEFNTEAKALNRDQEVYIYFDGSEPGKLDFFSKVDDKGIDYYGYTSAIYPNKELIIRVVVVNSLGVEYKMIPLGISGGMVFSDYNSEINEGEIITNIKVMGNVDFRNLKINWISRTGK